MVSMFFQRLSPHLFMHNNLTVLVLYFLLNWRQGTLSCDFFSNQCTACTLGNEKNVSRLCSLSIFFKHSGDDFAQWDDGNGKISDLSTGRAMPFRTYIEPKL